MPGVNLMRPGAEASIHYFLASLRDFRLEDCALHDQLDHGQRHAFEQQDKPMFVAQNCAVGAQDLWDIKPVILPGDSAQIHLRRTLRGLIRQVQQSTEKSESAQ